MSGPLINGSISLTNQDLSGYPNDYEWFGKPNCAPFGTVGPDRTYQIVLPAGVRVRIVVTPTTTWDPSVQLADTCLLLQDPMQACIAGVNGSPTGSPEVLEFVNPGPTRTAFLIVDTADMLPTVTGFNLDVQYLMVQPGDVCSSAQSIDAGTLTLQDLGSFASDYGPGMGCATAIGPDRVYSTVVPPGSRLSAAISASTLPDGGAGFEPALSFVNTPTCTPSPACVASSAAATGTSTTTLIYDNVGTTPENVFVIVDTTRAVPVGPFQLTTSVAPTMLPPGDVCGNTAAPITTSTMLTAQPMMGYTNHYGLAVEGTTCFFDDGPDRVYAVTVPAGFRLRALGNATYAYNLDIVAGPASNCQTNPVSCAARQTSFAGGALTATYDNGTATAQTVFVIVDRPPVTPMVDTFDLGIDLLMPPYTRSSIAANCQTLTAGAVSLPAVGDDVSSPWTALPFAFSYFGMPVTTYSVVSNGNVGFSNLMMGSLDNVWNNVSIPTAAVPNGMASVLWDDLNVVPMVSTVRSETFGTMGSRRFVVEWRDFIFYGGSTERMTFQLHAVEGTNVIEFHYCSMVANMASPTRLQGDQATVGLEDSTGTVGVESSFNAVNPQVVTGQGIRFTP